MKPRVLLSILLFSFFAAHPVSAQKIVSLVTTVWKPYVGEDIKNYGFASVPEGKDILEFMEPPLEARKLHLIFGKCKDNEQKLKDFNTGLQMIIEDGTVEKMLKKHGIRQ